MINPFKDRDVFRPVLYIFQADSLKILVCTGNILVLSLIGKKSTFRISIKWIEHRTYQGWGDNNGLGTKQKTILRMLQQQKVLLTPAM